MAIQAMVFAWAIRMAVFLLIRDHYRPEQRQYRLMRIEFSSSFYRKSLPKIFFGHAISAWIASTIFAILLFDIGTGNTLDCCSFLCYRCICSWFSYADYS